MLSRFELDESISYRTLCAWGTRYLFSPDHDLEPGHGSRPGIIICEPGWSVKYDYVTMAAVFTKNRPGSVEIKLGIAGSTKVAHVSPVSLRHLPRPPPASVKGTLDSPDGHAALVDLRRNLWIVLHETTTDEGFLAALAPTRNRDLANLSFPVYSRGDIIWVPSDRSRLQSGPWLVISNTQINTRYPFPVVVAMPMVEAGAGMSQYEVTLPVVKPETSDRTLYRLVIPAVQTIDFKFYFKPHECCRSPAGGIPVPLAEATYWWIPELEKCAYCDGLVKAGDIPWPKVVSGPYDWVPERARVELLLDSYLGLTQWG